MFRFIGRTACWGLLSVGAAMVAFGFTASDPAVAARIAGWSYEARQWCNERVYDATNQAGDAFREEMARRPTQSDSAMSAWETYRMQMAVQGEAVSFVDRCFDYLDDGIAAAGRNPNATAVGGFLVVAATAAWMYVGRRRRAHGNAGATALSAIGRVVSTLADSTR